MAEDSGISRRDAVKGIRNMMFGAAIGTLVGGELEHARKPESGPANLSEVSSYDELKGRFPKDAYVLIAESTDGTDKKIKPVTVFDAKAVGFIRAVHQNPELWSQFSDSIRTGTEDPVVKGGEHLLLRINEKGELDSLRDTDKHQ